MRKLLLTVLIVALAGFSLTGCANLFGFGSRSATVTYQDTGWCLPPKLRRVLKRVARRYGPVTVHSTHRWWLENRRKGGARNSLHLSCRAVDFSVRGDPNSVIAYLKSQSASLFSAHSQTMATINSISISLNLLPIAQNLG